MILRVEGHLESADLPVNTKDPLILPRKHLLTRLIILDKHDKVGRAGLCYMLMRTLQRFWIAYEISSTKRYLTCYAKSNCYSIADGRSADLSSNCHK